MTQNINNYIKDIINNNGPLSIDKFMQIASNYYYSNFDSIGQYSDFITAPEISQMFGEVVAIYLSEMWYRKIAAKVTLVELGPGNGTMMSDILRTMKNFKEIYNGISEVALIETSHKLRIVQENTLKKFDDIKINWYQDLDELHGENFIIVANEFFDALPIKQYFLKDNKIYEIVVSLYKEAKPTIGLVNNISNIVNINKFEGNRLVELSEHRENYVEKISSKISNNNGGAIIIDYGYMEPLNKSSLQAVKLHKKVELFDNIGESDITSLVDFISLQKGFEKNNIASNITNQSDFLFKYGILERGGMLIKSGASKEKIEFQLNKLTSDKEMGSLFKVLVT